MSIDIVQGYQRSKTEMIVALESEMTEAVSEE